VRMNPACERDLVRGGIVRINERRQIRETALGHVAFRAIGGADLHVAFHAGGDFDGLVAL